MDCRCLYIKLLDLFVKGELSSELFVEDLEYKWDLPQALKSAYILAADSLIERRLGETTLLLFYSAFLEECLSRGFDAVTGCWVVHRKEDVKAALREHGGKHSLFYAAEEGLLDVVAELIKEGADVNQANTVSLAGWLRCCKRM